MYKAMLGEKEYLSIKAQNPTGNDKRTEPYRKPEDQRRACETITDFERQGLDRLQIMPGNFGSAEWIEVNGNWANGTSLHKYMRSVRHYQKLHGLHKLGQAYA